MDKAVFIQGIRENPEDENYRLIYADYLEEQGDIRGELIRLQCELPKLDVMEPKWRTVRNRIKAILDQHADRWLDPLRELGANRLSPRCFQGGLLERVAINAVNIPSSIAALCDLEPALAYMDVHIDSAEGVEALADAAIPAQITAMDLSRNPLNQSAVSALAKASWWPQLSELNMQNVGLTDHDAQILSQAPLSTLTALRLGGNPLTDEAPIADFATLPKLRTLELDRTQVRQTGVQQITSTPSVIEHLNLASTRGGDDVVSELCRAKSKLVSVRTLNLRGNGITLQGILLFAGDHPMTQLETLDLRSNVTDGTKWGYGRAETPAYTEFRKLRTKYGDRVLL